MPQKPKITCEEILGAALGLVRSEGIDALNARALAARLHTSTQPVFSHFANMKELEAATYAEAKSFYNARIAAAMRQDARPYRASGMAYISFAREEPRLFRWLFMRDRSGEPDRESADFEHAAAFLQDRLGLSREDALLFHAEMWVVVHGIATMLATSYLDWNEETVSRILSDLYRGLLTRYGKEL